MRCTRSCGRCTDLAAEVERLEPEWQKDRDQYFAEHPATPRTDAHPHLDADNDDDL